tara:strand:+ start:903 stop:1640 length:738 start_codon:yes stop_codon:yes gene_type:complete
MPSTYTTNTGVEKPASGEQSGSWGNTVNTNMDIVDRALNGVVSISLSGTTSTLETGNGTLTDGQNAVLLLTGSLSAGHTITITPSDANKVYLVSNSAGDTVTFTQGSGSTTAQVRNNSFGIVYANGNNSCANLMDNIGITSLILGGTLVTSTATELNTLDGVNANLEAADLNLLDGAVSNSVVNSKAVIYGSAGEVQASTVDLGAWTITQSGTDLKFAYNGTDRLKLTSAGALTVENNITAYGSA